jgi:hypothetical protein
VSQVAVHHPSSYGLSGQVTLPATITGGASASFSFASLNPGAGAPATDSVTVAANGTVTQAHTYPAGPGTYTMFVTETASGRRVATRTVTLPYTG